MPDPGGTIGPYESGGEHSRSRLERRPALSLSVVRLLHPPVESALGDAGSCGAGADFRVVRRVTEVSRPATTRRSSSPEAKLLTTALLAERERRCLQPSTIPLARSPSLSVARWGCGTVDIPACRESRMASICAHDGAVAWGEPSSRDSGRPVRGVPGPRMNTCCVGTRRGMAGIPSEVLSGPGDVPMRCLVEDVLVTLSRSFGTEIRQPLDCRRCRQASGWMRVSVPTPAMHPGADAPLRGWPDQREQRSISIVARHGRAVESCARRTRIVGPRR